MNSVLRILRFFSGQGKTLMKGLVPRDVQLGSMNTLVRLFLFVEYLHIFNMA